MATSNFYFLTLDIETSKELGYSEQLQKEIPVKTWLSYGVTKLWNIKGECISSLKFRKWEELKNYYTDLSIRVRNVKLLCYVHNLSFEFDFLIKNIGKPKRFICNSSHSVIQGEVEGLRIDFRCTYQLSKLSLRKIGDMYNFPKGDCDYRTIYPEDTVLKEEWDYCERDNDILVPYILNELTQYRMLCNIPYTSTGRVRRDLKDLIDNNDIVGWDYMPPEDCFDAMVKSFRGGLTMSNPRYTNQLLDNVKIRCFDEKSKYPSVMLTEQFPYTIRRMYEFTQDEYKSHKFWIAKIRLNDLISNYDWGFLSTSTNTYTDYVFADIFNGKIINCKMCELYITNIDFEAINIVYKYKSVEFLEFYPMDNYSMLPKHFFKLICKYAKPKYELGKKLKDIEKRLGDTSTEWKECNREYMESKAKLNGIYGMMVQKLIPSEYTVDENFMWKEIVKPYKYIPNKHLGRNFIYGIMITSYSRYDLVRNIAHNCPNNFVYCDTDSIKFIDNGKTFDDLNSYIDESVRHLPYLKDFNRFEEETPYSSFITYGAKKYGYMKDDVFHFTVAGLPKSTQISSFDEFSLGSTYKNCKLAKRYIYNGKCIDMVEDEVINEEETDDLGCGGIALFEVDYTLEMTKSDIVYINQRRQLWHEKNIQQNIFSPN